MRSRAAATTAGSSPLARGLLVGLRDAVLKVGIIPARAGFTPPNWRRIMLRGDHPRSRGVYRSGRSRPVHSPWIIPARAGFTRMVPDVRDASQDHPRSRGVYSRGQGRRSACPGSSPLARGLLEPARRRHPRRGIIPARAGFTSPTTARSLLAGDHPRSRGVYLEAMVRAGVLPGSSPLARGLQPPGRGFGAAQGIIPARAGFTSATCGSPRTRRDHPRSRGVYCS